MAKFLVTCGADPSFLDVKSDVAVRVDRLEDDAPDVLPFAQEVGSRDVSSEPDLKAAGLFTGIGDGSLLEKIGELAPVILDAVAKVAALLKLLGVLKK